MNKDGYIYIISNPAMPGSFFSTKRYLKIGMKIGRTYFPITSDKAKEVTA